MSAPQTQDQLDALYGHVPVTALAAIFALDPKQVQKRLIGKVTPITENKVLKYKIRDAAPHLIDYKIDVEEVIRTMSPSKIPPALQDAFWKAQLSRQKYDENRGDLWRTARVIEVIGGAFKIARMKILMFRDNLQTVSELTDQQIRVVEQMSDDLLGGLRNALVDEFELYVPSDDEHGTPVDPPKELAVDVDDLEDDDGLGDD